jgi:hypothetical protein
MALIQATWKFSFTAIVALIVLTTVAFVIANIMPTYTDNSGNTVVRGHAFFFALIGAVLLIIDFVSIPIFVIVGVLSFILDKILYKPEDRQRSLNRIGQELRAPGTGYKNNTISGGKRKN